MASVPARWFSTSALSFRTTGTNVVLTQAATGAASGGGVTTVASYAGNATGVTLLKPDTTNSTRGTIPSVGAAAAGSGWRDDGSAGSLSTAYNYNADDGAGIAFQKAYQTTITGSWTVVVSMTGAVGAVGTVTIIVYAISSSGTDRELFRSAATTVGIGAAEANTTITTSPGSIVLNADEIIQREIWLNVTTAATLGLAYTVTFRDGVAGALLTQPSIQEGTTIVANIFSTQSVTSPTTTTEKNAVGKLELVTSATSMTQSKRLTLGRINGVTSATTSSVLKKIAPAPKSVTSVTTTVGRIEMPFANVPSGGSGPTPPPVTITKTNDIWVGSGQPERIIDPKRKRNLEALLAVLMASGLDSVAVESLVKEIASLGDS